MSEVSNSEKATSIAEESLALHYEKKGEINVQAFPGIFCGAFDKRVGKAVAEAVAKAASEIGVARK